MCHLEFNASSDRALHIGGVSSVSLEFPHRITGKKIRHLLRWLRHLVRRPHATSGIGRCGRANVWTSPLTSGILLVASEGNVIGVPTLISVMRGAHIYELDQL